MGSGELPCSAGKSVAKVREQYKSESEMADRAQATLDDKPLEKRLELETKLGTEDELSFEEKERHRKPLLVAALLLALAITGGIFAYTYTTTSATLTVTAAIGDFASAVSENTDGMQYSVFGKARGTIPAGYLFEVTPTTNYTGDLEVTVYLSNVDELSKNYRFLVMRLQLVNSGDNPIDAQGTTQVLSLENSVASFYFPSANFSPGRDYYVRNLGGAYLSLPWGSSGWTTYNPVVYCQVTQAGL